MLIFVGSTGILKGMVSLYCTANRRDLYNNAAEKVDEPAERNSGCWEASEEQV